MRLNISKLKFSLPEDPFGIYLDKVDELTKEIKALEKKAGTGNDKFQTAYASLCADVKEYKDLSIVLDEPIKVRALSVALQSKLQQDIKLTAEVFAKIDELRSKPSSLLIESVYQHYLSYYDKLEKFSDIADWLKNAMAKKEILTEHKKFILSLNGPKWIVEQCVYHKRDFSNQLEYLALDQYASGRFLTVAKNIYFVQQLEGIPSNKPHDILVELQKKDTYESRYDEHLLLGHKVLEIIIRRAPETEIDDSWLNAIMTIAGDPRVPSSHPNYLKWWSALDSTLSLKVRGWLSRYDSRLFLEALENYSHRPNNVDLKRMYPARKVFIEGLLKNNLVTGTRLFLTPGFISYLKRNYETEHLPNFSVVSSGDKSIIHIQLGSVHMIEGSHSCKLWVYKSLDPTETIFDYNKKYFTYYSLTSGLYEKSLADMNSSSLIDSITHSPPLNWQNKAIKALKIAGVNISPKDVLLKQEHSTYKRRYGAR